MAASEQGHQEVVARLIRQGVDVNALTKHHYTALTLACEDGNQELVDLLIKAGADLELGEPSPLMTARQEGHLELASYLRKAREDKKKERKVEDAREVDDLVSNTSGSVLPSQTNMAKGRTPLMSAAFKGETQSVRQLIEDGADVNAKTIGDRTPLMVASEGGREEVVKLLLQAGANIEDHDDQGSTALTIAVYSGHFKVAR